MCVGVGARSGHVAAAPEDTIRAIFMSPGSQDGSHMFYGFSSAEFRQDKRSPAGRVYYSGF
eukprot:3119774-Lingulodinium_polyedra.AAC.1